MEWHFPLINPVRKFPLDHFLEHVIEGIVEFEEETDEENKDKEAVDILHAAETFVRKYFESNGRDWRVVRDAIIQKNKKRGYYDY